MVCPNCGHEIKPGQNFCDNCGLPLKKNINVEPKSTKPSVKDDAVRSLSDIEQELDQQEKQTQAQKSEQSDQSTESDVDDRTRVYNFKDEIRNAESQPQKSQRPNQPEHSQEQFDPRMDMAPAQKAELERQADLNKHPKAPDDLKLDQPVHLDPVTHLPVYPDDKPLNNQPKQDEDENDGLFANMMQFLKNNVYVDIIAVLLVVATFFIKRNYSWILLAIFLVAWFLTSQIIHGKEIKLNKLISRHGSDKKEQSADTEQNNQPNYQTSNQNYQPANQNYQQNYQNPTYNQPQQPVQNTQKQTKREKHAEEKADHHRNWQQKLIIFASIIGFIASITGPFVNNVSLSATIANAANVSVNFGAQTNLIMNASSAVRFICFISPVIVLIAANFRNRGSIRIIKTFSMLASVIYIVAFVLFSTNLISASLITGQYVQGATQIGASFYILIITSVLSLLLAYTLRPRNRK